MQVDKENDKRWENSMSFREGLLDVVEKHLPSWVSNKSSSGLETVILSGDIPAERANDIAKSVSNILSLPSEKVIFTDSLYRAAMGAACHAYRVAANPPPPIYDHPPFKHIGGGKDEL